VCAHARAREIIEEFSLSSTARNLDTRSSRGAQERRVSSPMNEKLTRCGTIPEYRMSKAMTRCPGFVRLRRGSSTVTGLVVARDQTHTRFLMVTERKFLNDFSRACVRGRARRGHSVSRSRAKFPKAHLIWLGTDHCWTFGAVHSPRPALGTVPVPEPRPKFVSRGTDAGTQCQYLPCE
jgi:hypothetical protein